MSENKTVIYDPYVVSLVYTGSKNMLLRVLVIRACSEDEALGKAVKHFRAETDGYGLGMNVVIKLAPEFITNSDQLPNIDKLINDEDYVSIATHLKDMAAKLEKEANREYTAGREKRAATIQYLQMSLFESTLRCEKIIKVYEDEKPVVENI